MAAVADSPTQASRHQFLLKSRRQLDVQGVVSVISFDEGVMVLETDAGPLVIRGEGMHVLALDVQSGTMTVEGLIHSMEYAAQAPGRRARGLLSRLTR